MNRLFVDTSAWVALTDSADRYHQRAIAFRDEIAGQRPMLTTSYVLDETYTLLLLNIGYAHTVSLKKRLDTLVAQQIIEVVWVDQPLADDAWQVFERFNTDKVWSYTDCISYSVMRSRGLTEAFAFDHHFEQMGFVCLPR